MIWLAVALVLGIVIGATERTAIIAELRDLEDRLTKKLEPKE